MQPKRLTRTGTGKVETMSQGLPSGFRMLPRRLASEDATGTRVKSSASRRGGRDWIKAQFLNDSRTP
jgi:hypothetical protein